MSQPLHEHTDEDLLLLIEGGLPPQASSVLAEIRRRLETREKMIDELTEEVTRLYEKDAGADL